MRGEKARRATNREPGNLLGWRIGIFRRKRPVQCCRTFGSSGSPLSSESGLFACQRQGRTAMRGKGASPWQKRIKNTLSGTGRSGGGGAGRAPRRSASPRRRSRRLLLERRGEKFSPPPCFLLAKVYNETALSPRRMQRSHKGAVRKTEYHIRLLWQMRDPFRHPGADTHPCSAEQGNQVKVLDMFCGRNRGESGGNAQFNSCDCGAYLFSAKAGHWRS